MRLPKTVNICGKTYVVSKDNRKETGPPWPFMLFIGLIVVESIVGFMIGLLYITGNLY